MLPRRAIVRTVLASLVLTGVVAASSAASAAPDDPSAAVARTESSGPTGWYVATTADATTFGREDTISPGLEAVATRGSLGIGFAFRGFVDDHNEGVVGGYWGVVLRLAAPSATAGARPFAQATVGYGLAYRSTAAMSELGSYADACDDAMQTFYVGEPLLGLELDVASFARVTVAGGYRLTHTGSGPFSRSDLEGFVGRVTLELGRF